MADDPSDEDRSRPEPPGGGLDRSTQEHLGQRLRAALNETAPKPAYLGDPALPPEFEHQLLRLEGRIEVHEKGIEAVRKALGDLEEPPADE